MIRAIFTARGVRVPYKTPPEIRDLAMRTRSALHCNEIAVDVIRLLEHVLPQHGIDYHIVERAEMPHDGAKAYPDRRLIVIRDDVYDELIEGGLEPRFTVPHEIGHLALEHSIAFGRSAPLVKHSLYEDSEWQADTFAAEFMMPVEHVRRYCRCGSDIAERFKMPIGVAMARRNMLHQERLVGW